MSASVTGVTLVHEAPEVSSVVATVLLCFVVASCRGFASSLEFENGS